MGCKEGPESATAVTGSPGGAAESPGRFACSEWPAPPLQRVYGSHWRWTGVARRPQRCRNISCSGQCSTVAKRRRGLGGAALQGWVVVGGGTAQGRTRGHSTIGSQRLPGAPTER